MVQRTLDTRIIRDSPLIFFFFVFRFYVPVRLRPSKRFTSTQIRSVSALCGSTMQPYLFLQAQMGGGAVCMYVCMYV